MVSWFEVCVIAQLRMLFFQDFAQPGASIKFGDFIEYKPKHAPDTPVYVHVAFNSKEQYDDAVADEKGDHSKVDLFGSHSTFFLTWYVLADISTWKPCSAEQLKAFAKELGFDQMYGTGKLENFWSTNRAHKCVMELVFKKGQYTDHFKDLHRNGDDSRDNTRTKVPATV